MRRTRRRYTKPGRVALRSPPRWSATRSLFTTGRNSFRFTSPRTWSVTNSASSRRPEPSRGTRKKRKRPRERRNNGSDRKGDERQDIVAESQTGYGFDSRPRLQRGPRHSQVHEEAGGRPDLQGPRVGSRQRRTEGAGGQRDRGRGRTLGQRVLRQRRHDQVSSPRASRADGTRLSRAPSLQPPHRSRFERGTRRRGSE